MLIEPAVIEDNKAKLLKLTIHELRNRICPIITITDLIKSEFYGKMENPEYAEFINDISDVADEMLKLTDDLTKL